MNNISRRRMLQNCSTGFGSVALSAMMSTANAKAKTTHHQAKAKHVIFCFMSGGVSHVDSFDPKPKLKELHGKPMPVTVQRTQFNNNGSVMASPFEFNKWGESGLEVSDMFPELGSVADELAVVRSMTTPVNEHAQGNFFMHSGFPFMGHPSAGAWCGYGLGSENENLPSYVVLQSGKAVTPHGGVGLFSNGFLPAQHQGSILKADQGEAIKNIKSRESRLAQRGRIDFASKFDQSFLQSTNQDAQVEAAIKNYETAFLMQSSVPELCDISDESQRTRELYGLDSADTEKAAYARQCLLARRLVQRGVRFIELTIPMTNGYQRWDAHGDLKGNHERNAAAVDRPITALIHDLKRRGMLDDTLVVWGGEFGRTVYCQGKLTRENYGRDHHPRCFSMWMAGAGIKPGVVHGETDDFSYNVTRDPVHIHELNATILQCLGVDHRRLVYKHQGLDMRLTGVEEYHPVKALLS